METSQESNSHPTAAAVADSAPEPNPTPQTAPPPPDKPPDRPKLRLHYFVALASQQTLIDHHSAMIKPGATTTYIDQEGNEVTRRLNARETLRHAQELHNFSKLALNQQKLDAAAAQQNGDNKPKTL